MTCPVGDDARDRHWMEQALALAALGDGCTSPNPRVGCVLVRDDRVVGTGFHRSAGMAHAEAVAVEHAGELARGATAYVNLEPCAHHGRTPPCADLLIDSGVRRVVAALRDPNPLVDGKGFEKLRRAGVEVVTGLLEEAASRLNDVFLHWHREARPMVTVKAAASLDGMLAGRGGSSRWITGPWARRFAHRLRARHDAVLVGAGTVRRDDPRLTVRLGGLDRHPLRLVLAPSLDLPPEARFLSEASGPRPRIYVADTLDEARERPFRNRADIVRIAARDGNLALDQLLADLAGIGVQSVLVEGGGRTIARFVGASLADRAAIFLARKLIGAQQGTPLVDGPSVNDPGVAWELAEIRQLPLADDLLLLGRIRRPETRADPAGR